MKNLTKFCDLTVISMIIWNEWKWNLLDSFPYLPSRVSNEGVWRKPGWPVVVCLWVSPYAFCPMWKEVFLQFRVGWSHPGEPLIPSIAGLHSKSFWSNISGVGPRMCISNKFLETGAVVPGTIYWGTLFKAWEINGDTQQMPV